MTRHKTYCPSISYTSSLDIVAYVSWRPDRGGGGHLEQAASPFAAAPVH
jgi:hypothetical protein